MTWRDKRQILYYFVYATILFTVYEFDILQNYGFFHQIPNSIISHVVPLKRVYPPHAVNGTIYQPIIQDKEIRLLVLEPGAPGDELKCRLIHAQLSWRTKYEALSYQWGDGSSKRQLSCSGSTVDETVNLYEALSDLRHLQHPRILWVDRLCINQDDYMERKKQVMLMGEIYSQARQVLIYLGKIDSTVEGAMESIRWLDRKFMPLYIRHYLTRFGHSTTGSPLLDFVPKMKPIQGDNIYWDRIINLVCRPWFQRTWVIQESVLPKNAEVICGEHSVPWPMLARVVSGMTYYHYTVEDIPGYSSTISTNNSMPLISTSRWDHHAMNPNMRTYLQRLCSALRFTKGSEEGPKLLDLIVESRTLKCTDPRDKVFGMLGVTGQNIESEYLAPNYSISPENVFRNFVLWDIRQNGSLESLAISSDKAGNEHLFPSWVLDLNKLDAHFTSARILTKRVKFDASAGLPVQERTSDGDTVLHLKGRIIDTLHTVGKKSIIYHGYSRITAYENMRLNKGMVQEATDIWLAATKRSAHSYSAPKTDDLFVTRMHYGGIIPIEQVPPNWEPFLRTLICNLPMDNPKDTKSYLSPVASFVRPILAGNLPPESSKRIFHNIDSTGIAMFRIAAMSRHFAGTDTGLIGYVPMRAKKGDLVIILYGADVPFVVRRTAGGRYSLIGECYMDGIMNGEAIKTAESKDRDVEFA